jgi:FeS assembly SUF system regulator
MLRLSKLTDYGTVIMAVMAREPARVFSASELAGATGVAGPTVSKILKTLTHEQLLQSLRGTKGGYLLARAPAEISIAQVIDALEGPLGVTECSVMAGLCLQEARCPARANWMRVNQVIRQALDQVSLADMALPAT